MAEIVAEFFGIIGLELTAPQTMSELIPYVLQIVVALALVLGVFECIKCIISSILSGSRRF